MDNKIDLTIQAARNILTEPGYDAYGNFRIYGILDDGQILAIKSEYQLDRFAYARVWVKSNNGMIPIRRA